MPTLKNKPLVEAILEVRWELSRVAPAESPTMQGFGPPSQADPHFRLLTARLFDRFQERYPFDEQLPAANLPAELLPYTVQHRFRSSEKGWPLVQVGPGILTLNDTSAYKWRSFSEYADHAVRCLFSAHPRPSDLRVNSLALRYIDAFVLNKDSDALEFLRTKLKIDISLPEKLFGPHQVHPAPASLAWECSFEAADPGGRVTLRLGLGETNGNRALIMETQFESASPNIPALPEGFAVWASGAHQITRDWFFTLIEGDLYEHFEPVE